MREEDKLYQEIENYLNGSLTGEEKNAFEQKLNTYQELQNKVKLSKLANDLVIENRLLNVKQVLYDTHNNNSGSGLWKKIVISTAGILLVGNAVWFIFSNKENKNTTVEGTVKTESPSTITSNSENTTSQGVISKSKNNTTSSTVNIQQSIVNETAEEKVNSIDSLPKNPIQTVTGKQGEGAKEVSSPPQPTIATDPCQAVQIKAKVTTVNPCEGEENGSIIITGIKNGTAPYNIQLNDENGNTIHSNNNLKVGSYSAIITDSKGCTHEISNISLSGKKCSKDYAFNPFVGDVWQIPVSENSGTLTIHDKAGDIYLQKELAAGNQEVWDGHSQQGELKTGYFIYTISYTNGTTVNGSVTVVR